MGVRNMELIGRESDATIINISKKLLDYMKNRNIIPSNYTGKITHEININQGGITDIKILLELRYK